MPVVADIGLQGTLHLTAGRLLMIISSKQMAKSKPVLDLSESYVIRDAAKVSTFIEKHRSLLSDAYMEIHRCLPGAQVFLDIVRYTGEKDRQEFVISILTHLSPDAAVGSLRKSWRESSRQVQARLHVKLVHCGARGLLRTYGLFGPEPEQESTTLEEIIGMNLSVTRGGACSGFPRRRGDRSVEYRQ